MFKLIAITLSALVAVSNGRPTTLPLVVPVNITEGVPKVLPIVVPVNPPTPVAKTLPLVVPVGQPSPVPKTLPIIVPVESSTAVPKILPIVVPINPSTPPDPRTAVKLEMSLLPINTPLPLAEANNHLGLSLLKNLEEDDNIFFSPFSLSSALTMLYSGAKGTTAQQMRQILGFEAQHLMDDQVFEQYSKVMKNLRNVELKNNKNSMNVANKMVVNKNFDVLDSYKSNVKKTFDSSVDAIDFADNKATEEINEWVKRETKDKIQKLLDGPLDPNTKLVLLNAIYFKGVFQTQFDEKQTRDEVFFTDDNKLQTRKMMKRNGKFNFTEIPEIDSTMIEMPYSGNDISLYVVLPNDRQGLKRMNKEINDWSQIEIAIDNLQERKVEVSLPKFKMETSYKLKSTLSSMGMSSVFTPSADLSGIDGRQDLEVGEVMQKAFVEINEEGTEAAAATAIDVIPMAVLKPEIPVFRADHPFMFFIRDNVNRMNLFVGQIKQL